MTSNAKPVYAIAVFTDTVIKGTVAFKEDLPNSQVKIDYSKENF